MNPNLLPSHSLPLSSSFPTHDNPIPWSDLCVVRSLLLGFCSSLYHFILASFIALRPAFVELSARCATSLIEGFTSLPPLILAIYRRVVSYLSAVSFSSLTAWFTSFFTYSTVVTISSVISAHISSVYSHLQTHRSRIPTLSALKSFHVALIRRAVDLARTVSGTLLTKYPSLARLLESERWHRLCELSQSLRLRLSLAADHVRTWVTHSSTWRQFAASLRDPITSLTESCYRFVDLIRSASSSLTNLNLRGLSDDWGGSLTELYRSSTWRVRDWWTSPPARRWVRRCSDLADATTRLLRAGALAFLNSAFAQTLGDWLYQIALQIWLLCSWDLIGITVVRMGTLKTYLDTACFRQYQLVYRLLFFAHIIKRLE